MDLTHANSISGAVTQHKILSSFVARIRKTLRNLTQHTLDFLRVVKAVVIEIDSDEHVHVVQLL
jgi:hypothetical protein